MEANMCHDTLEVNLKAFSELIPVKNIREWSSRMKSGETGYWYKNFKKLSDASIIVSYMT
jgi:hypothetical protein